MSDAAPFTLVDFGRIQVPETIGSFSLFGEPELQQASSSAQGQCFGTESAEEGYSEWEEGWSQTASYYFTENASNGDCLFPTRLTLSYVEYNDPERGRDLFENSAFVTQTVLQAGDVYCVRPAYMACDTFTGVGTWRLIFRSFEPHELLWPNLAAHLQSVVDRRVVDEALIFTADDIASGLFIPDDLKPEDPAEPGQDGDNAGPDSPGGGTQSNAPRWVVCEAGEPLFAAQSSDFYAAVCAGDDGVIVEYFDAYYELAAPVTDVARDRYVAATSQCTLELTTNLISRQCQNGESFSAEPDEVWRPSTPP